MSWWLVAILAYLFLAIANLLDKFLVDKVLPSSRVYAFIVCLFGSLSFLAAPWFLKWPGWGGLGINLLAGAVFAVALWLLYESLRRGEASRALVLIGGATPVFSLIISAIFLKETPGIKELIGISCLIAGIMIVAFLPQQRSFLARVLRKLRLVQDVKTGYFTFALSSALAYSLYFLISKQAYLEQEFLSAFIWTRLGALILVLFFLFSKPVRRGIHLAIRPKKSRQSKKPLSLIIINQLTGATGFLLQNYAIFLGSVVLVNALQGVQYAFLLIISTVLAVMSPKLLKETFSWKIFLRKTLAVVVIAIGLFFII